MSNRNNDNTVGWLARYRRWLSGLSRQARIRYRVIQAVSILCAALVLLWVGFVRRPDIPALPTGSDLSGEDIQTGDSQRRSGVYTILVVGRDTGGGGNTDTMLLAAYDTKAKTVDVLSLPRDTMVNVSWSNKKLNTVYNYYKGKDKATQVEKGMSALKTHVGKLTGIVPDFYVMVDWDAVGELVNAIGGVTFNVPYDMHYDDPYQDLHIHQEKGERRLTGEDAMQVIRWRKNNGKYGNFQVGDSGRMKIQQDFLMAVAKECLQLKHLMNASEFARIFTEKVSTDLTVGNLAWFAQQAIGMDAAQALRFHTMPYTPYTRNTAYVLPVVDALLAILNDGLNPYKEDITAEDLEVLQLKKDGSFYLTSGTLEDSSLAKPRKAQEPAKPVEPEEEEPQPEPELPGEHEQPGEDEVPQQPPEEGVEPVQPEVPVEGEISMEGETPVGGEMPQPEQPADQPPEEQPDLPEEIQNEGNVTEETQETQETDESVQILPAHPVPIQ